VVRWYQQDRNRKTNQERVIQMFKTILDETDLDFALMTRLNKAIAGRIPVTITYTDAKGDETIRTIEPYAIDVSAAGDLVVIAMDRGKQAKRNFRLDRIQWYTIHRGNAFQVTPDGSLTGNADEVIEEEVDMNEITDYWSVTNRAGEEVAQVFGLTREAAMIAAEQLAVCRRVIRAERGLSTRRLCRRDVIVAG
jgi:predicted DNA-binding transcriptional regulator YafY